MFYCASRTPSLHVYIMCIYYVKVHTHIHQVDKTGNQMTQTSKILVNEDATTGKLVVCGSV